MLSRSSRLGVAVVVPLQKSISSKTLLLPSPYSPLQTPTCCCFPHVPYFNPFGPILRNTCNFLENFLGPLVGQQQQRRQHSSGGRHATKGFLDNSVTRKFNTSLKGGTWRKHGLFVDAVASIDDPQTNSDDTTLHDELQRHGVHESDYIFHKTVPQVPNSSQEDVTKHKSVDTSSSKMPRKRKPSSDLTSGSKHPVSSKKNSRVAQDWCCYLLLSVDAKKTYVGVTFDIRRRLMQHNGEISGGAKSARAGRPWRVFCTVKGFRSRSEACQFEWQWKSTAAKRKVVKQQESETEESPLLTRRRATLAQVLETGHWNHVDVQWRADD